MEVTELRLKTLEEAMRKNGDEHREFYQKFEDHRVEQTRIDEKYVNILQTLAKIDASLEEIKSRPQKKLDIIWNTIIQWLIIGALSFYSIFKK